MQTLRKNKQTMTTNLQYQASNHVKYSVEINYIIQENGKSNHSKYI